MSKVMMIDDDKEFLSELTESLSLVGYETVPVGDALQAVEKALTIKPDIILVDLKMPRLNGFSLTAELKHFTETMNVPVIAITGYFREDYVALMNLCGIHGILRKPFNVLEAITKIEEALKFSQGQSSQGGTDVQRI